MGRWPEETAFGPARSAGPQLSAALAALLVLLANVAGVPAQDPTLRVIYTAFGLVLLVLVLSVLDVTVFQSAPTSSWRGRLPTIFVDVARFLLIGAGLALTLSLVWGPRSAGCSPRWA